MSLAFTVENTQESYITSYWFMFDVCCEGYFPFTIGLNEDKQHVSITLLSKDGKEPLYLLICYEFGLEDIIIINKSTSDFLATNTCITKELRTAFNTARLRKMNHETY